MRTIEDITCTIRVEASAFSAEAEEAITRMSQAFWGISHSFESLRDAFMRVRTALEHRDFANTGLDGAAYVEEWDPDFDPRSTLLSKL